MRQRFIRRLRCILSYGEVFYSLGRQILCIGHWFMRAPMHKTCQCADNAARWNKNQGS